MATSYKFAEKTFVCSMCVDSSVNLIMFWCNVILIRYPRCELRCEVIW